MGGNTHFENDRLLPLSLETLFRALETESYYPCMIQRGLSLAINMETEQKSVTAHPGETGLAVPTDSWVAEWKSISSSTHTESSG